MLKVTTKEKGKLAFGYWDDEKGSCWSLVEVAPAGNNWCPTCLKTQYYAELKALKDESLDKVNSIVGFFERYEDRTGLLSATSVKLASLRRVSNVNDLKKHKEECHPLLNEEVKEGMKCSMHIVNKLIDVNDLMKHKEVKEAFLGKDMKEL